MLLEGEMPSALNPPAGCRFHTRCPFAIDRCRVERPVLVSDQTGHATACHRTGELPPPETIVPSDAQLSPTLERLLAAFSASSAAAT
jgi:peptide/nickel transport system ATP-binding protein/oligopeptide transport system ATP-binding protein